MSHETAPKLSHTELHTAIDEAALASQEATKRYRKEGNSRNFEESMIGSNFLQGDPNRNLIRRSSDSWYGDKTKVEIRTLRPSAPGEDPYKRAATTYDTAIHGQNQAKTKIERTNARGEVVYTHESHDLQLARRIGKVGAKSIVRQNTARSDFLKNAA